MLDTFSVLTLQLAKAYGIAILAIALTALAGPARMGAVIADFERQPALVFITALFALFLGLALVMLHNLWTDPTAILVSLLGWLTLVKSLLLLAAPVGLLKFGAAVASSPARIRIWGVAALILAAIYLVLGLAGHASVGAPVEVPVDQPN